MSEASRLFKATYKPESRTLSEADLGVVGAYFVIIIGVGLYLGCSLFVSNIGSQHFIGLAGSGAGNGISVGAWELNAIFLLQMLGWLFAPVYIACGVSITNLEFVGGLTAVIYTDTLQALLMVGGSITLTTIAFNNIGGYEGLVKKYPEAMTNESFRIPNTTCHEPDKNAFRMLREADDDYMPWLGFLLGQTPSSIWYWCTDQVIVQRVLAAKSISHAKGATLLAGFIKFSPLFLMVMPGMISRILYPDEVACVDKDICYEVCQTYAGCTNIAYPRLVLGLMPEGVRGLMMAVMIAALMSDLDSIFNSSSTLFTIDIYQRIRKSAKEKERMIVGRIFIVVMVALAIAWVPVVKETQGGQVFIYTVEVANYLSPPFAAIFLLAVLVPRINEKGAFWSMMVALVVGLARMILVFIYKDTGDCLRENPRPSILKDFHYLYFTLFLTILTIIVAVCVSFLTEKPSKEQLHRTTWWTRHDEDEELQENNTDLETGKDNEISLSPLNEMNEHVPEKDDQEETPETINRGAEDIRLKLRMELTNVFIMQIFSTTVGCSLFVSNIGSQHFIGLAGSGAGNGISVGAWELSAIFFLLMLGWLFAPVYFACGVYTMPEYLSKRFGGSRLRIYFAAVSLILYIMTKCSTDLYTGALFIQQSLRWDLYLSISIPGYITGILTLTAFNKIGGYEELVKKYPEAMTNESFRIPNTTCHEPDKNAFRLLREADDDYMPWLGFILGQASGSIWYWCTDQVIVQRVLAAKSISHAKGATLLAGFIKFSPLFLMVMPGMISRILYPDEVACVDKDICYEVCQTYAGCTNIAYPRLVVGLMPEGVRGLMMAVMIASLMSDLDSIFNSSSTLFTIDIYQRIRTSAKEKERMIVGRIFIVVLVAVAIAWVPVVKETQGGQVFIYAVEVMNYLAPPFAVIFLLAVLVPRINEKGAFWSMMVALVVGLARMILVFIYKDTGDCLRENPRPSILKDFHYLYFTLFLTILTIIVAVSVSLLTEKPSKEQLHRTTWWTRHDEDEELQENNTDLEIGKDNQISLSPLNEMNEHVPEKDDEDETTEMTNRAERCNIRWQSCNIAVTPRKINYVEAKVISFVVYLTSECCNSSFRGSQPFRWDLSRFGLAFTTLRLGNCKAMYRSNRATASGYFLAERAMYWFPVGCSLFVSNIGSQHFIGLAGSGAGSGISVGAFEFNIYTMPEYLSKRYGGSRLRITMASISLVIYVITKCSTDLYTGAIFIQQSLRWDLYLSIITLVVLTGILTLTGKGVFVSSLLSVLAKGGLTAVIYTDTLQAMLMIGGGLTLSVMAFTEIGGFKGLIEKYPEAMTNESFRIPNATCHEPDKDAFTMLRGIDDGYMPWLGFAIGQTITSIWYWCADQVIVQRLLASKSISHAKGATLLAGMFKFLPLFFMVMPGMISRILYPDEIGCVDKDICYEVCQSNVACTNVAYPRLVLGIMPEGLRGLMMAVLVAALMSDLDSIFNSSSTLFTIDIYQKIRTKATERERMIVGRLFIILMVVLAIAWVPVVKEMPGGQVFLYTTEITNYVAPPFAVVFLLGIFVPRINEKGAFWSLMVGYVVGITRMVLVLTFRDKGDCTRDDQRPAFLKNFHYMYFTICNSILIATVATVISLLSEKPTKEQLCRTTWWTRTEEKKLPVLNGDQHISEEHDRPINTEEEISLCNLDERGNDLERNGIEKETEKHGTGNKGKGARFKDKILSLLCGFQSDKERAETVRKLEEHLRKVSELKQNPVVRVFLNIGLVTVLSLGLFGYVFFSFYRFKDD
ncbi:hypothetical protein FSP39_013921 [Pinctada imbricata]|uniref:Uncharacterized protein n=1 Tax=Pinctada imbricata TaxID=66713 RepID=A0AA88YP97_PINIB|nr:hypothetical protein FSP39_013921 [Pinctada imbricata]